MGKDPAVLFYTSDFLVGTALMNYAQRGKYITLLCLQHQGGRLSEVDMLEICGGYDEKIFSKFEKDEEGRYYNKRMEVESIKRKKFVESRQRNLTERHTDTHMENHMDTHMKNHMDAHMENGNRNKNISISLPPNTKDTCDIKDIDDINIKSCPYKNIMDLYNSICTSFSKIRIIDGKRKEAVKARWKTYGSIDVFKELFERAEASRFLKGENDGGWKADFDWMMRPTNMAKILEGKYDKLQTRPSGNIFLDILREEGEI